MNIDSVLGLAIQISEDENQQTLWIDELKQWWMGVFRNSLVVVGKGSG